VEAAVKALHAMARPVQNETELAQVALTVIRDPEMATLVGEMSYLLGADAHVTIEKYVAPYLQQFYMAGATVRAQIASMYFYTDSALKTAVATNSGVALIDGNLNTTEEAVAILRAAQEAGVKSLTIIAGQVSDAVIGLLTANSRQGDDAKKRGKPAKNGEKAEESKKPVILAVKPKDVGDARRALFDDLALITGGQVLGRAWSRATSKVRAEDLGRAQRVEFGSERTIIVPDNQNSAEVQAKSTELRNRLAELTLDDEARPLVVQRLALLSGGMGILKIGTESKLDREVRAQNAERAFKVTSAAQHTGVVPGGGAAYFHAISALDSIEAEDDVRFGVQIVQRALQAPLRQILENAHVSSASVIMDQIRRAGPTYTYDAMENRLVDAYDAGILDVAGVMGLVLQTAASAALMALTTDTIVYHKNPQQAMNP
jgi:chaperonin GroEL